MLKTGIVPSADACSLRGRPQCLSNTAHVAAGSLDRAWAANLLADPELEVTIAGRTYAAEAEVLVDRDPRRGQAVRELILRYGTPSEGLGSGPIFVVRRVDPSG